MPIKYPDLVAAKLIFIGGRRPQPQRPPSSADHADDDAGQVGRAGQPAGQVPTGQRQPPRGEPEARAAYCSAKLNVASARRRPAAARPAGGAGRRPRSAPRWAPGPARSGCRWRGGWRPARTTFPPLAVPSSPGVSSIAMTATLRRSRPPWSADQADQGGGDGGGGDDHQEGGAQDEGGGSGGQAGQAGVDGEAAVVAAEGLGDDQGGQQGGGGGCGGAGGGGGRGAAGEQEGAGGLDGDGGQADHDHADPDGAHDCFLAPTRQARLATTIGIPGPVKGIRARAMAAPPMAARRRDRSRTWGHSRARNRAGNAASRPSDSGSATRLPAKVPMAVPVVQQTSRSRPAPTSRCRSRRPSSRWAMAQDSSTISWEVSARGHHGPFKVVAADRPIGP